MSQLPVEMLWLQAIALIIIPFVAAWVAWGQLHVARTKLKYDLFERRFKLYDIAANFISHVLQHGTADNRAIMEYSRQILDAEFLTSKKVSNYLNELREQANALHSLEAGLPSEDGPERENVIAKHSKRFEWFCNQPQVLKNHFLPLIGFEEMGWGPPSTRL